MTTIFRLPVEVGPSWTDILVPVGSALILTRTEFSGFVTYWSHQGEPTAPPAEAYKLRTDTLPLAPGDNLTGVVRGVSGLVGAIPFIKDDKVLWVYKVPVSPPSGDKPS